MPAPPKDYDGGLFSGDAAAPLDGTGTGLWFRGRRILEQVVTVTSLLATQGLDQAIEVDALSGGSAGGLPTYLPPRQLDRRPVAGGRRPSAFFFFFFSSRTPGSSCRHAISRYFDNPTAVWGAPSSPVPITPDAARMYWGRMAGLVTHLRKTELVQGG